MVKIIKKIGNVLSSAILIAGVLCLCSFLITGIIMKTPNIFGYRIFHIMSGSMEPTIMTDDFVIAKTIKNTDIKKGDIIAYQSDGIYIIHRVINEQEEYVITKGDNNTNTDNPVIKEKIKYKIIYDFQRGIS